MTPSAGKTPTNAKWEEEFDKKFCYENEDGCMEFLTDYKWGEYKTRGENADVVLDVKDFISNLLLERERELIANIRRWLGNGSYPIHDCEEGDCHERLVELLDHMEALSKAQSLLRDK